MTFLIGILSAVLLLDCFVLVLLVLIQLPKKEAGAGIAFGAGTADALFGAGSGNALTKITKYAATIFLGLSLMLTVMQGSRNKHAKTGVGEALKKVSAGAPAALPPASAESPVSATNKSVAITPTLTMTNPPATNASVAKTTNAPANTVPAPVAKP